MVAGMTTTSAPPVWPLDAVPRPVRMRLAALRIACQAAPADWDENKIINCAVKLGGFLAKASDDADLAIRAHALDLASQGPLDPGYYPTDLIIRYAREFHRHAHHGPSQ
jgi:hypothetical protein